jgi:hypothetical protein
MESYYISFNCFTAFLVSITIVFRFFTIGPLMLYLYPFFLIVTFLHLLTVFVINYIIYGSAAQPFHTCSTLIIVEESWRHTNTILHIVGGEMVYGIDWP